jgi:hypothetical protein
MYLDPSGTFSWKACVSAAFVVIAVKALDVLSAGVGALALGFGSSVISGVIIGGTIFGLVCGSAEMVTQGVDRNDP